MELQSTSGIKFQNKTGKIASRVLDPGGEKPVSGNQTQIDATLLNKFETNWA
jgi:hypothetical protein